MQKNYVFSFVLSLIFILTSVCFVMPQKAEKYYCDATFAETGTTTTSTTVTIPFDTYTMSEVYTTNLCPNYRNLTQTNACAPLAGSIILGYWDLNCPNLLPNFETGYTYEGVFYYKSQDTSVIAVKEHLYDLMGTNTIAPGTSVTQFINGMNKYMDETGYDISYQSCQSTFDINTAVSYIEQQKPIVMFLSSYNYIPFGGIAIHDADMTLLQTSANVGHVVVAFGYREYSFYQNGELYKTDRYMIVSFGDGSQGLISINDLSTIDTAYAITIS